MRFDPHAFLERLGGGDVPPPDPAPRVAQVARVARPHPAKLAGQEPTQPPPPLGPEGFLGVKKTADLQAPALPSDPDTYLAALRLHGPMTYGAAAVALGWGATRAWQAEASLVAEGRATLTREGRACPPTR